MEDEVDIAPEGTYMLEPRDMFDKAFIGVVHQAGVNYAVYDRHLCIELLIVENLEAGASDEDAYTDAVDHYGYNVSGSIGVGFPVFWSTTWSKLGIIPDPEVLARSMVAQGNDQDEDDWMAEFNWHRDEANLQKARRAARSYVKRYTKLVEGEEPL